MIKKATKLVNVNTNVLVNEKSIDYIDKSFRKYTIL